MLILTRKSSQRIRIGSDITVTVLRITGSKVQLGIEAPLEVPVLRTEIMDRERRPPAGRDWEAEQVGPVCNPSEGLAEAWR